MLENLEEDYKMHFKIAGNNHANPCLFNMLWLGVCNAGFRAVFLYRLGRVLRQNHFRIIAAIIERIMHHVSHCWISTNAQIGGGFVVTHVGGLVIGSGTVIGKNCQVRQNVTFGGNYSKKNEGGRLYPIVGDNISIGAGAVIIGPVKVGSNSIIGANTVVTRDMPENVIAFGVPAKIIKARWHNNEGRDL
jgi:serine O-acetyltransferase